MAKRLWLAASLLVAVALLVGGCVKTATKGIEPLTAEEEDRLMEIALNTPEVSEQLEKAVVYNVETRWVALVIRDSEVMDWGVLTEEEVETGIPQGFLSSFTIYPGVLVHCIKPERLDVLVAVDLDTGEVVHAEVVPAELVPAG